MLNIYVVICPNSSVKTHILHHVSKIAAIKRTQNEIQSDGLAQVLTGA